MRHALQHDGAVASDFDVRPQAERAERRSSVGRSWRQHSESACAKETHPGAGTIEKLVDEIEDELQKQGRAEVSTRTIGELAMEKLSKTDRVAYIRFASVYRDFTDEEDFRETIEALADGSTPGSTSQLSLIPPERSGGRPTGTPPQTMTRGRRTSNTPSPVHTDSRRLK